MHHLRLSSKQQVILNSQLLCFVPFMVFEWHSRRIYSLCLKTVIVARSMVIIFYLLYQLVYTNRINRIILYQFVFATPGEWLYKLFMHQVGGPAQVFPPKRFFLGGRPLFPKRKKHPKNRQTPNKERPFF
jgi:hypothetical protein